MPGKHIQRIGIYHHPNLTGTTPLQQTLQRFHRPGILSQSASDTHCRITCHVGRQFRKTVGRIQTDHGRRKIRFDRKTFAFRQMHRHQSATRTQSGSCGKHGRPGIPLEPQTNKACPYMPLWASSARGFTNALTSSHVTYPNPHPERSANASLTPGGRNMISPFTIIL